MLQVDLKDLLTGQNIDDTSISQVIQGNSVMPPPRKGGIGAVTVFKLSLHVGLEYQNSEHTVYQYILGSTGVDASWEMVGRRSFVGQIGPISGMYRAPTFALSLLVVHPYYP